MTVHIGKLTSEVTVQDADTTLSPAQIERIVSLVLSRLEDRAREARRHQNATVIHKQASKSARHGS